MLYKCFVIHPSTGCPIANEISGVGAQRDHADQAQSGEAAKNSKMPL